MARYLLGPRADAAPRGDRPNATAPGAIASVDAPGVPGPLGLADGELLHLSGRGFRQRAEGDRIGAFEVGDAVATESDYLSLGGHRPVLERDERLGPFAPAIVGNRDDGAFEDGRVGADRLLDLDR